MVLLEKYFNLCYNIACILKGVIYMNEIQKYFKELESIFSKEDLAFIKAAFYAVKDSFDEAYYYDIIQICCEDRMTSLDSKMGGITHLIGKVYAELGDYKNQLSLHSLPVSDQLYEMMDEAATVEDLFNCDAGMFQNPVENDIILSLLNGEKISDIARRYGIPSYKVHAIFEKKVKKIRSMYHFAEDHCDENTNDAFSVIQVHDSIQAMSHKVYQKCISMPMK